MALINVNSNFHHAAGTSVVEHEFPAYQEYRRRWREDPATFTVGPFPIHLDIESTDVCNLRCPFCATTTDNWGPVKPGYMQMGLFKRIIDEGADNGLCSIKLSFRGEPMLHQQLPEMVSYAKEKGIMDIYFNTNGTMLREDSIRRLIDAGLDRISISFEGTTKEVYESKRVGAKYEEVIENVRTLRRIREEKGVTYPKIRIQTVMLPDLKDDFSKYVDFWSELADEVAYLDGRREGPDDNHKGMVADWACPFLYQRMTILWDGTLLPCLMHGVAEFGLMALGNVQEVSIRDMWLSARENMYRDLHKTGQAHKLEACDRCSYRAMELEKMGIGG